MYVSIGKSLLDFTTGRKLIKESLKFKAWFHFKVAKKKKKNCKSILAKVYLYHTYFQIVVNHMFKKACVQYSFSQFLKILMRCPWQSLCIWHRHTWLNREYRNQKFKNIWTNSRHNYLVCLEGLNLTPKICYMVYIEHWTFCRQIKISHSAIELIRSMTSVPIGLERN